MKMGEKVKKFRELKNLTQEYVAGKLGITQQAYQLMESKEVIQQERLEKIANILGVQKSHIENFEGEHIFYQYNHDNSKENIQYLFNPFDENIKAQYEERIKDLKATILSKDEVIAMQKKMIELLEK